MAKNNASAGKPVKTTKAPTRQMWRRSVICLVVLLGFCFSGLAGKLAVLQIVQADEWQKRAVSQQLSDSVETPQRGSILDANMQPLATSAKVWKLVLSPLDLMNLEIKKDETTYYTVEELRHLVSDGLASMLDLDSEDLYQTTLKTNSQYEVVKTKIEYEKKEELLAWIEENSLGGALTLITDYKRYYPLGNTLSNVLGFVGTDNTGLEGLEAMYDSVLTGKAGRTITARNGLGEEMPTTMEYTKVVDAQDGYDIVLTIDQYIQTYAEKYLEEAVEKAGATNRGAVIIQDVNTGAILAMATKGDYDPNEPFVISDPTTATQIAELAGDEQSAALTAARQKQWQNKPIVDCYEPGSVFKVFTSCMAFEEGVCDESTTFTCEGSIRVKGWDYPISCHVRGRHGTLDFPHAVYNSCNPFFVQVGLKLGGHNFFKYFTGFGFTQKTGIDMIGEQSNAGLYYGEDMLSNENSQSYLATAAFGQTFKVTPIQMITAMSAVANGGKLMQPYVVQKILDSDGNVVETVEPTVKRQVISEETAKRVSAMLDTAVNTGSKNAYVAGYRVAGKTGTSEKRDQVVEEGELRNVIGSFAGFAPVDDPQIAILLLIDEPQGAEMSRFGSSVAAPYAQKILADVLPYLGIEPKYTEQEIAAMNRTTPKVEGSEVVAAQAKLTNAGFSSQVLGSGTTVIKQVPEAGKPIPKEGKVTLYTDDSVLSKTVQVPDFSGKSLVQSKQAAESLGLNLQLSGNGLDSGEAKASSQSIDAGTSVPPGTVIDVTFIVPDTIG